MDENIRNYLKSIGKKGGQRSRRKLSPENAKKMVRIREARRAYKRFHSLCFWSYDPNYKVNFEDLEWLCDCLNRYGDRSAWEVAACLSPQSLCH